MRVRLSLAAEVKSRRHFALLRGLVSWISGKCDGFHGAFAISKKIYSNENGITRVKTFVEDNFYNRISLSVFGLYVLDSSTDILSKKSENYVIGTKIKEFGRENLKQWNYVKSNYSYNNAILRGTSLFVDKRIASSFNSSQRTSACGLQTSANMAKSRFEYVKQFEIEDRCLPNCWIVIRIDGKAFHRFSDTHHFVKPNDERGLGLMTRAAQVVMEDFKDVVLAYGQSDEYSFVFKKNTTMYNRRGSKIMTNLVSLFSSSFVMNWPRYFASQELQYAPAFDARVVLYPSDQNLRDYLSWRQADCHINNLYNTVFWKLVQERCLTPAQAQERLKGTMSSDKNEILFADFNINYNNLPEIYRKGTILLRNKDEVHTSAIPTRSPTTNYANHSMSKTSLKHKPSVTTLHCDLIGQKFWDDYPEILDQKKA